MVVIVSIVRYSHDCTVQQMNVEGCALLAVIIVLAVLLAMYVYLINDQHDGQGALRAVCTVAVVIAALLCAWLCSVIAGWVWQGYRFDHLSAGMWSILFIGALVLLALSVALLVPRRWFLSDNGRCEHGL